MQQVLRKRFDIIVRHIGVGGKYHAEVLHHGEIVARLPDDCLATNSLLLTSKIWYQLYKGVVKYPSAPAFTYLAGKNIKGAVESVDFDEFERVLLPVLKDNVALKTPLQQYELNKARLNDGDVYELYDALVRIFCHVRGNNTQVTRKGIEGLRVVTDTQALTDTAAVCIDVTDSAFVAALKIIHPGAVEHEEVDKKFLVKFEPVNVFGSVCGDFHRSLTEGEIETIVANGAAILPMVESDRGVLDGGLKTRMIDIVGSVLGQGGNPATPEEAEVVGFFSKIVGLKKMGRNALVGLGSVAGQGPLNECLDRVYIEVRKRCRGVISDDDCYRLAACKLAGMNSAKICTVVGGVLCLSERSGMLVGEPANLVG